MLLKREQVPQLARKVSEALKKFCTLKTDEKRFFEKIESVILKNLQEEQSLEEQVRKLMDQYRSQIAAGSADPQRLYTMIKRQVAKERKFVL